jgi:hypothetical protein
MQASSDPLPARRRLSAPHWREQAVSDRNMSEPPHVRLWDGTIGAVPPEPEIECSLGERRAACIADVQLLNELIQELLRNCDPAGIDNLLGMISKHDTRRTVFGLKTADRHKLARTLREREGVVIDPKLLREDGWEILIDALVHRRALLEWLTRYCNLIEVR